MNYKLIFVIIAIIVFYIINIKSSNKSSNNIIIKENYENNKYYTYLTDNWNKIFVDGNRNSASSMFFKFIIDIPQLSFTDFLEYNKLYCAVSGSLISPNSPANFIMIEEFNTNQKICGDYYMCCWPCLCDVMKYAKVIKMNHKFTDGEKTFYAITIANPCSKTDFPAEVTKSYICNGNKLNTEKNHIIKKDGVDRLVIGVLHNGHICSEEEQKQIMNNDITGNRCNQRNNMPIDKLQYGMGDIFIKLAK